MIPENNPIIHAFLGQIFPIFTGRFSSISKLNSPTYEVGRIVDHFLVVFRVVVGDDDDDDDVNEDSRGSGDVNLAGVAGE